MCYQFCGDGKGVCIKNSPVLQEEYVRKVDEYQPDLIVIMDKPDVEDEFLRKVSQPVLWIDHHEPQDAKAKRHNVTYLNPRSYDDKDNRPTSYWVYLITETNLWIATVGAIGDWYLPDWLPTFGAQYPDLIPATYEKVEDIYLDTRLGEVIKAIQFNLKGPTHEVRKSILTLTRIHSPEEILRQTTPRGKYIWKKYRRHATGYERHLEQARLLAEKSDQMLCYVYDDNQTYTSELSNELLIRYPDKVTLVCRKHDGKRKCSVRTKKIALPEKIQEALSGLRGRGGGHTNACGVVVDEDDWDIFYARLTAAIEGDADAV